MSKIIEDYYKELDLIPLLTQSNMERFNRNPDIASEFEYWIENKEYQKDSCVEVEGYTAEGISRLSNYLVGESSFLILIELREEPEKAKKRIARGFKIK